MIRISGSSRMEEARLLRGLSIRQGDTVVIVRPEGQYWLVLSAFDYASAPKSSQIDTEIATPSSVVAFPAYKASVVTWETPPTAPEMSYQVEIEGGETYNVRGTVFIDNANYGAEKRYRVRCVDSRWRKSGWSAWVSSTPIGIPHGDDSEKDAVPGNGQSYFAVDTRTLYLGYNESWIPLSGGASAGGWDIDAVPDSPSSYDDECNGSSVSGIWNIFDPDSILAATASAEHMELSCSERPGTPLGEIDECGLYQSLPSGDFTFVAKVKLNSIPVTDYTGGGIGITLWEDATDSDNANIFRAHVSNRWYGDELQRYIWKKGPEYGHYLGAPDAYEMGEWVYLRVRRSSDAFHLDVSTNGTAWVTTEIATYMAGWSPAHFGIGLSHGGDIAILGEIDFFRYRNVYDDAVDPVYGAGVPLAFTSLSDTPDEYDGQAGKSLIVNSAEDGLEFGVAQSTMSVLVSEFDWESSSPVELGEAIEGEHILSCQIIVDEAFDGTVTLSVGEPGGVGRLMGTGQNDPYEVGEYINHPNYTYPGDSTLHLYITSSGASQGAGRVIIHKGNPDG